MAWRCMATVMAVQGVALVTGEEAGPRQREGEVSGGVAGAAPAGACEGQDAAAPGSTGGVAVGVVKPRAPRS